MRWPAIPSLPGEQAARYRPCPYAEPDQAPPPAAAPAVAGSHPACAEAVYRPLPPDRHPQDRMGDKGWTFETLEHGGEYPDNMPQAIRATDAEGRSCIYLPIRGNGQGDSLRFNLSRGRPWRPLLIEDRQD